MLAHFVSTNRARFEREAAFVADQTAQASDLLHLNIGGERFLTVPRSTLTSQPDSMLSAMFSGRHKLRTDDNGRAYINRSGKYFVYILDYLRNGGVPPSNLPAEDAELRRVCEGMLCASSSPSLPPSPFPPLLPPLS